MALWEKIITNEQNRRRFRKFLGQRRSVAALSLLGVFAFFSFTAEFWSNSKPLFLHYHGKNYFPVVATYHPTEFGVTDMMQADYRALALGEGDFALWPVNRWDPFESNKQVDRYPSGPSRQNWLGTDDRGRDIAARLLYGFRYSLSYAMLVWLLTTIVAVSLGGAMGYFGGRVDLVGQRVVEILNTVPIFFLLIILVSLFEPTLSALIVLSSLFGWIGLSYYVRGEFLKNRKMDFVESARSLGAGHLRLIFRHVLPNSLVPVITFSPFIISSHVLGLASLDYLGFGLRPPTPSWGEMLNQAQQNFTTAWWLATFPSLALFMTLVLLAMVGEGVRQAFDPKRA